MAIFNHIDIPLWSLYCHIMSHYATLCHIMSFWYRIWIVTHNIYIYIYIYISLSLSLSLSLPIIGQNLPTWKSAALGDAASCSLGQRCASPSSRCFRSRGVDSTGPVSGSGVAVRQVLPKVLRSNWHKGRHGFHEFWICWNVKESGVRLKGKRETWILKCNLTNRSGTVCPSEMLLDVTCFSHTKCGFHHKVFKAFPKFHLNQLLGDFSDLRWFKDMSSHLGCFISQL